MTVSIKRLKSKAVKRQGYAYRVIEGNKGISKAALESLDDEEGIDEGTIRESESPLQERA